MASFASCRLDAASRAVPLASRGPHSHTAPAPRPARLLLRPLAALAADTTSEPSSSAPSTSRRALLGRVAAAAALAASAAALPAAQPAGAVGVTAPFLQSTGGKGLLAEEEERLFKLRQELEGDVRREIEAERVKLEEEGRASQFGKLCATPFGIDIVGITEFIALVGALVGGITARQRKAEMERLNEQLRKINMSLRQQARAGTVYAPGLTYAPPTGLSDDAVALDGEDFMAGNGATAFSSAPVATATVTAPLSQAAALASVPQGITALNSVTGLSMEEEEMSADQLQCRDALRSGKRLLKDSNGAAAMVRFEKALMLSKALQDRVQERRAVRGLAASARLQGQYRAAIKHLERVLEISRDMREYTGDADAYGTIADCYTDLGMFENAAEWYDKYIERMNRDGPV